MTNADLRRYAGQWVAAKGGRALFGAPTMGEVFDWLNEYKVNDATVVRLPGPGDPKTWTYGSLAASPS